MSDTSFDPKAIEQIAEQKAQAKMEELKNDFVKTFSRQKPETPPESWSSFKNETVEDAVKKAEETIMAKVQAEREEEKKKQEADKLVLDQQTKANTEKEWADQSAQWKEAVDDGLIPAVRPEVAKAVEEWQRGGRPLTQEEYNDPGLVAFRESKALHDKLRAEGKSTTFYRTIEKFYNKKPAGASAPVIGSSRAVAPRSGFTYEEIHKDAMRRLNHPHR
jgi:hypothetical protein